MVEREQDNNIESLVFLEKSTKRLSNWLVVLLVLPFNFFLQIAFNTTFNRYHNQAMFVAALIVDAVILVRVVIGLIWQPQSKDWKVYLYFLWLSVPLLPAIGLCASLGEFLARR